MTDLDLAESIAPHIEIAIDRDGLRMGLALANGMSGCVLFLAELARVRPSPRRTAAVTTHLERLSSAVADSPIGLGLFTGLAGVLWALRRSANLVGLHSMADDKFYADAFAVYRAYLSQPDAEYEYDLISGIAGIGMWALSLNNAFERDRLVRLTLARLEERAQPHANGLRWETPSSRPRRDGARSTETEFNLGLAHGAPGVVGFLAECVRRQVAHEVAFPLLQMACRSLLAQRQLGADCYFPDVDGSQRRSRVAWCYGDLGVGLALYKAAGALRSNEFEATAREVLISSAMRRRKDGCGVRDSGICHGSAGLWMIFSQLRGSGFVDDRILCAIKTWRDDLLAERDHDRGICGFYSYKSSGVGNLPDPSYLTGAAGVGLALMADELPDDGWAFPLLASFRG